MKQSCLAAAAATLAMTMCWPAEAQQRGGAGAVARGGAPTASRPMTTTPIGRGVVVRGPMVRDFEPHRGDDTRHLRRRIYNACHGDSPPDFCRRIYGDHNKGNLRQRIRYACFSADSPPVALCRRVYGDDWHRRPDAQVAPPMPVAPASPGG